MITNKHLPFSNKSYQPEINVNENKYLTGLLMSCQRLLHVTVQHSLAVIKTVA